MLTLKLMERLFPTKGLNRRRFNLVREREKLVEVMNQTLPEYGITTYRRICAFLGNCGIETDYFRTTEEYASGAAYEGRRNLGNFIAGDGTRFKGRDLTQTTGRYNYWRVVCRFVAKRTGKDFSEDLERYRNFKEYLASTHYRNLLKEADRLDCNFLAHPERLAEIEIAVQSACIFWEQNELNSYADRGEFRQLSGIVNRGDKDKTPLHWAKRNSLYKKCKIVIPTDFSITLPSHTEDEPIEVVTEVLATPEPDLSQKNDEQGVTTDVQADAKTETKNEDVIASAFDKNVSPEQIKDVSLSVWTRIWRLLIRPLTMLYAALEAGNIYAWLGVVLAVIFIGVLVYLHRADIKRLWQKLVQKLTEKFTN